MDKIERMVLIGTSIISLGIGYVLGRFITRKHLDEYYLEVIAREHAIGAENLKLDERWAKFDQERKELETRELLLEIEKSEIKLGIKTVTVELPVDETEEVSESLDGGISNQESDEYDATIKAGRYATPESAAKHLISNSPRSDSPGPIDYTSYASSEETSSKPSTRRAKKSNKTVVSANDTNGGGEMEKKKEPYVISSEDFFRNEDELDQQTLTFYEADKVLSDPQDRSIEDKRGTVGDHILNFGHLSGDPNVVYVRNDRLQLMFEVVRDPGSFAEKILGFEREERT